MSVETRQFQEMVRVEYQLLRDKAKQECTREFRAIMAREYGYRCPTCGGKLVGKPDSYDTVYVHELQLVGGGE